MNDGTESMLCKKDCEPNKSFIIPSDIKITKLRSCLYEIPNDPGLFYVTQFELFDSNGGLILKCGKAAHTTEYFETTVPEDETVVGFKVVTLEGGGIRGLGLVTAKTL